VPRLDSLIERLASHQVEFVVVGGFAAVAHGSTLLTEDIDVCLAFTPDNLSRLLDALEGLHPVHRMTPQRMPLERSAADSGWQNLYLDTDLGQLDCLGRIDGVGDFASALEESEKIELEGGKACRILNLEALIRSKEALGRPKDRETVIQLRAIRERREITE